jgi:hypothetical protein
MPWAVPEWALATLARMRQGEASLKRKLSAMLNCGQSTGNHHLLRRAHRIRLVREGWRHAVRLICEPTAGTRRCQETARSPQGEGPCQFGRGDRRGIGRAPWPSASPLRARPLSARHAEPRVAHGRTGACRESATHAPLQCHCIVRRTVGCRQPLSRWPNPLLMCDAPGICSQCP